MDELIRGVVGVQAVDASKSKACNKHALLVSEQEEFELSLLASHKQHDHADGLLLPAQGMRASPGDTRIPGYLTLCTLGLAWTETCVWSYRLGRREQGVHVVCLVLPCCRAWAQT